MQRFFDILFSVLAIVLLFPFMVPVMIGLKLTGEHDVFYKQVRVGRFGREFKVLKFATMLRDSPNLPGGTFTYKDDPRILPLGKFLRKTKINELPQLINILTGDMSIVGYRPLVPDGYAKYSSAMKDKIFNYKPGLSGIGSIMLHNEEKIMQDIQDKDGFYRNVIIPYKGALESWYIEHYGISAYFKIIFMTVYVLFFPNLDFVGKVFKDLPEMPSEIRERLL